MNDDTAGWDDAARAETVGMIDDLEKVVKRIGRAAK